MVHLLSTIIFKHCIKSVSVESIVSLTKNQKLCFIERTPLRQHSKDEAQIDNDEFSSVLIDLLQSHCYSCHSDINWFDPDEWIERSFFCNNLALTLQVVSISRSFSRCWHGFSSFAKGAWNVKKPLREIRKSDALFDCLLDSASALFRLIICIVCFHNNYSAAFHPSMRSQNPIQFDAMYLSEPCFTG